MTLRVIVVMLGQGGTGGERKEGSSGRQNLTLASLQQGYEGRGRRKVSAKIAWADLQRAKYQRRQTHGTEYIQPLLDQRLKNASWLPQPNKDVPDRTVGISDPLSTSGHGSTGG